MEVVTKVVSVSTRKLKVSWTPIVFDLFADPGFSNATLSLPINKIISRRNRIIKNLFNDEN